AEYRLRLRANNASTRLTPLAIAAGCVGPERRAWFEQREQARAGWAGGLAREVSAAVLGESGVAVRRDAGRKPLSEWLRYPDIGLDALVPWHDTRLDPMDELAHEIAEVAAYAPYLERQESELRDLRASEAVVLGEGF